MGSTPEASPAKVSARLGHDHSPRATACRVAAKARIHPQTEPAARPARRRETDDLPAGRGFEPQVECSTGDRSQLRTEAWSERCDTRPTVSAGRALHGEGGDGWELRTSVRVEHSSSAFAEQRNPVASDFLDVDLNALTVAWPQSANEIHRTTDA